MGHAALAIAAAALCAGGCERKATPPAPAAADAGPKASSATAAASATAASSRGDAGPVPSTIGYDTYTNGRFGFGVEYPTFMSREPEPTNQDGQAWTFGGRATMTAWGMHAWPGMKPSELCADAAGDSGAATASRSSKDRCWITGKHGDRIFWERRVVSRGTLFGLSLEYDEDLKTAFDPIIAHVSASWSPGRAAP